MTPQDDNAPDTPIETVAEDREQRLDDLAKALIRLYELKHGTDPNEWP